MGFLRTRSPYQVKNAATTDVKINQMSRRYCQPEYMGSWAMVCAMPTVNGFTNADENPVNAPMNGIDMPTTVSYPSESARGMKIGIKMRVSSSIPNSAPHSENRNIHTGMKHFLYWGLLAKKKLTFLIIVLMAPVRSIIVNSAPTTRMNAIISAHWVKPSTGAARMSPMFWGAFSTAW